MEQATIDDPDEPQSKAKSTTLRPRLTIAVHPDGDRIGQSMWLAPTAARRVDLLSRLDGEFEGRPLDDASVSRRPVRLVGDGKRLQIDVAELTMPVFVDGRQLLATTVLSAAQLEEGVALRLGRRVLLWLEVDDDAVPDAPAEFTVGRSLLARKLSARVIKASATELPALIRGATGSGKERVARALHALGPRKDQPFIAVNMAAIPASTATSALFGHMRGAFTGAEGSSPGYFRQAQGGVLFLDELAAAPPEIQDALLRVLDSGEIQPVGAKQPQVVDVRVVAATDADLDEEVAAARFRPTLRFRLERLVLHVPRLVERRADIPGLFAAALREAFRATGQPDRLQTPPDGRPWLTPALVERLLRYPFPGNIRELRNLADRLAFEYGVDEQAPEEAIPEKVQAPAKTREPVTLTREPVTLTREQVRAALVGTNQNVARAARLLGVSNPMLHEFLQRTGLARRGCDVPDAEFDAAVAAASGDLARAAEILGVSLRSLQLRRGRR